MPEVKVGKLTDHEPQVGDIVTVVDDGRQFPAVVTSVDGDRASYVEWEPPDRDPWFFFLVGVFLGALAFVLVMG